MGRVAERIMFTLDLKTLLELDEAALKKLRKVELIEWTLLLQKELVSTKQGQQQEQDDQINKKVNEEVNKPSSKKPEWDIVHGCTGAAKHRDVRERPKTAIQ